MNPQLPEKPMTTEEMAKLLESPTEIRQDELLAIARRLRLLEAVAKGLNKVIAEGDGPRCCGYAANVVSMEHARAALSADERGGKEGEDGR